MNVLVSFALSPAARAAYALRLTQGSHDRRRDVLYRSARTVTVEGEPFYVSADGEIQGPLSRRTWEVRPGALRMVTGPVSART